MTKHHDILIINNPIFFFYNSQNLIIPSKTLPLDDIEDNLILSFSLYVQISLLYIYFKTNIGYLFILKLIGIF